MWRHSPHHTCQMWRNFRFLHIFHMAKFEITPHMEKFQISPHLSLIEIWNFSTWQIFLHMSGRWYRWQISGMHLENFQLPPQDWLSYLETLQLPCCLKTPEETDLRLSQEEASAHFSFPGCWASSFPVYNRAVPRGWLGGRRSKEDSWSLARKKNSQQSTNFVDALCHCCYQGAFQEVNILMNRANLTHCKI